MNLLKVGFIYDNRLNPLDTSHNPTLPNKESSTIAY